MENAGRIVIFCLITRLGLTVCDLERYFNIYEFAWRNCTNCPALYRETKVACNSTSDSICGACISGDEHYSYSELWHDTSFPCLKLPASNSAAGYFKDVVVLTGCLLLMFSCLIFGMVLYKKAKLRKLSNALAEQLSDNNCQNHGTSSDLNTNIGQTDRVSIPDDVKLISSIEEQCDVIPKIKQETQSGDQRDRDSEYASRSNIRDDIDVQTIKNDLMLLKIRDLQREAAYPKSKPRIKSNTSPKPHLNTTRNCQTQRTSSDQINTTIVPTDLVLTPTNVNLLPNDTALYCPHTMIENKQVTDALGDQRECDSEYTSKSNTFFASHDNNSLTNTDKLIDLKSPPEYPGRVKQDLTAKTTIKPNTSLETSDQIKTCTDQTESVPIPRNGFTISSETAQNTLQTIDENKQLTGTLRDQKERDSGYSSRRTVSCSWISDNSLTNINDPIVLKISDLRREAQDPKSQKAYPQLCKHILDVCEKAELSKENGWLPVDFRKVEYKTEDRSFSACIVSKEDGALISVGLVSLYIPPDSMPTDDLYLVYLYVEGEPRRGYSFRYGPHGLKLKRAAVISFPTNGYSIFLETDTGLYEQDKWEKSKMYTVTDGERKHVSLKHFSGGQDKSEQELQVAFRPRNARTSLMAVIFGPKTLQKDGNNIQVCLIQKGNFQGIKQEKRRSVHPKCLTNWSYYGTFDLKHITITVKSTIDDVSTVPQKKEIAKDGCFDNDGNFDSCEVNFTFDSIPDSAKKIEFTISIEHEKNKAPQFTRVSLPYSSVDQSPSEQNSSLHAKATTLDGHTIEELQKLLSQDDRYIILAQKNGLEDVLKQCTDDRISKDQIVDTIFHIVYHGDAIKLLKNFEELKYDDCMRVLRKDKNYSHIFGGSGRSLLSGQSIESPSDQSNMSVEATDEN